MRILYVVHQFFPKHYLGTERVVLNLSKQMQRMGHSVRVLTYGISENDGFKQEGNFLIKEYEFHGVSVISIRHKIIPQNISFTIFDPILEKILGQVFFNDAFDIIHICHPMRVGSVIRVAKHRNIPIVLTLTDFWLFCPRGIATTQKGELCHGPEDGMKCVRECYGNSWKAELIQRFNEANEVFQTVNCVVFATKFLKQIFEINNFSSNIKLIPFGNDYNNVVPNPKEYSEKSEIILGFLSTVTLHKGAHVLLEAFNKANMSNMRIKIYGDYFGDVDYYNKLKKIADNKKVEFCGKYKYEEMPDIFDEIDMLVLPSIWWENSPLVLLRALANNVPAIVSDLGGMTEVIVDGKNGFTFKAGSAESLAEILQKIGANPTLLNEMKTGIHHPPRIEEEAFEYEQLYSDLIGKGSSMLVKIDHINNMEEIRKNLTIYGDNFFFDIKNKTYKSIGMFNLNNLKIITRISKRDTMFQGNLDHYFSVGMSALHCIEIALFIANKKSTDIKKILDLACGYGRVMRIIKAAFQKAAITACELDKVAVDYCVKTFSATPAYSSKQVSEIKIDDSFDLIWNGSLLTHLDSDLWEGYIRLFESLLKPNGILIFTVHGCLVADKLKKGDNNYYGLDQARVSKILKDYEDHGFGYVNYCNETDYGISISSRSWVLSCLENISNLHVLAYAEHLWDNHQDVVICIKDSEGYRKSESKVDLTTSGMSI